MNIIIIMDIIPRLIMRIVYLIVSTIFNYCNNLRALQRDVNRRDVACSSGLGYNLLQL